MTVVGWGLAGVIVLLALGYESGKDTEADTTDETYVRGPIDVTINQLSVGAVSNPALVESNFGSEELKITAVVMRVTKNDGGD